MGRPARSRMSGSCLRAAAFGNTSAENGRHAAPSVKAVAGRGVIRLGRQRRRQHRASRKRRASRRCSPTPPARRSPPRPVAPRPIWRKGGVMTRNRLAVFGLLCRSRASPPPDPTPSRCSPPCGPGPRGGSSSRTRLRPATACITSAADSTSTRCRRRSWPTCPPTTATSSTPTARAWPPGPRGAASSTGATIRWTWRRSCGRGRTSSPRSSGTRPETPEAWSPTRRASCSRATALRRPDSGTGWKCLRNEGYGVAAPNREEIRNEYYVAGPGDKVTAARYPWG